MQCSSSLESPFEGRIFTFHIMGADARFHSALLQLPVRPLRAGPGPRGGRHSGSCFSFEWLLAEKGMICEM